ncbi:hypothetical protein CRE_22341 [Caenorhabditis remanei]|uniref:Uncharacterized protein n=1 Tax=Caenorhabditis remanei TaxID=31234 RepID=E3ME82_CAERE|nr:hypothetical protein CRE_22341 [Caenorhabditis remanei]
MAPDPAPVFEPVIGNPAPPPARIVELYTCGVCTDEIVKGEYVQHLLHCASGTNIANIVNLAFQLQSKIRKMENSIRNYFGILYVDDPVELPLGKCYHCKHRYSHKGWKNCFEMRRADYMMAIFEKTDYDYLEIVKRYQANFKKAKIMMLWLKQKRELEEKKNGLRIYGVDPSNRESLKQLPDSILKPLRQLKAKHSRNLRTLRAKLGVETERLLEFYKNKRQAEKTTFITVLLAVDTMNPRQTPLQFVNVA